VGWEDSHLTTLGAILLILRIRYHSCIWNSKPVLGNLDRAEGFRQHGVVTESGGSKDSRFGCSLPKGSSSLLGSACLSANLKLLGTLSLGPGACCGF
jgi:hypothetical protein